MRREVRRISSSNRDAASADAATEEHDDDSVDEHYG